MIAFAFTEKNLFESFCCDSGFIYALLGTIEMDNVNDDMPQHNAEDIATYLKELGSPENLVDFTSWIEHFISLEKFAEPGNRYALIEKELEARSARRSGRC